MTRACAPAALLCLSAIAASAAVAPTTKPVGHAKTVTAKALPAKALPAKILPQKTEPAKADAVPARPVRPGIVWTSIEADGLSCGRTRRKLWQAGEGWIVKTVTVCR